MDILSIIFLAIGLAMDCFAVSIAQGLQGTRLRSVIPMAILFGLFQGGMPLIAYFAGSMFAEFFTRWSPWIALVLLMAIGGKMLVETCKESRETKGESGEMTVLGLGTMLVLAIATSIDAFSIGVLFIPVSEVLWLAVSIIAAMSTLFSLIGFLLGKTLGCHLPINANVLGGCILVAIGLKLFIEGVLL